MENPNKIKNYTIEAYIDFVYVYAFLLTGSRIAAEEITIETITESCHSFIYSYSLERCLYAAYHKGIDACSSYRYEVHDHLSRMLSKLTYLERSIVLLRYRYNMTYKKICRIIHKKRPEVIKMTRKALEQMMRDNQDEYMCFSECETAEHISG